MAIKTDSQPDTLPLAAALVGGFPPQTILAAHAFWAAVYVAGRSLLTLELWAMARITNGHFYLENDAGETIFARDYRRDKC